MNLNEVVYVGNVPKQATDKELTEFFKDVGKVIKVSFMRENRNDCRHKVAFVLFENEMQALKACSADQTIFQWNRVIVMLVNDERAYLAGHTVAVRNISFETNEEDLFETFGRYGMIDAVQIPMNNLAYIGFKDKSAAIAAQRLNNTKLGNNRITVQVLQRNIPVRLEDLDNFKAPRVYNELMDAKLKFSYAMGREPVSDMIQQTTSNVQRDDYEDEDDDDDEDNRIYDPVTNRFYDKPKKDKSKREASLNDDHFDEEINAPSPLQWHNREVDPVVDDLLSPRSSSKRDILEERDEPQSTTGEILRRSIEFVKTGIVPLYHTKAVKVENIPRDVYDEDVIKYFDQYGPIASFEIGVSESCIFNKTYTIVYQNESTAAKVLECFMRKCELSGVVCTMFTMRPEDALREVPGKCVIVDYLSTSVVFEDVVDAFRGVGEVIYVTKTARNTSPSVVHFKHRISLDRAKDVKDIDGDKVRVVPFSYEAYRMFESEGWNLRKASTPYSKKPLKNVRMMDIQMKEQQENTKNMIVRTVFNPNYRNPEPDKLNNEVVIYNCPTRTTLKDLRRHFINAAFVTNMRYEQSPFDTNTWKVYASFPTFMDAFNAVRLKGMMLSLPIFKHLASEKPKLDTLQSILIDCDVDDISVTKMHNCLVSHGAVTFVDKVGHSKFVAICRDAKTAKKIALLRTLAKSNCKVALYRDIMNEQNARKNSIPAEKNLPHQQHQQKPPYVDSSRQGPPIPMDEIIAIQRRIMNDDYDGHRSSRDNHDDNLRHSSGRDNRSSVYDNEWEREFDRDGRDSSIYRRNSIDMDLADDDPGQFESFNQQLNQNVNTRFNDNYMHNPPFEQEGALVFSNPPAPNEKLFGVPPREPMYPQGWAPGGPMHAPPVMVPPPMNRNVFFGQPAGLVASLSPGTSSNRMPFANVTIHHIQPDAVPSSSSVSQGGDLRQYLAEKRNTRPREVYDPTEEFDQQMHNLNYDRPTSPKAISRIENYIREKEIEIQQRLKLLDKKLTTTANQEKHPRERSVSPTDRLAHNRIEEIGKEKSEITRKLQLLLKSGDRDSLVFQKLCESQSAIDKECLEIKRQLEAKKLWLAERARSLSGERQEKEVQKRPTANARDRRSRSRSTSRGRRRSISRDRTRNYRRSRSRTRRSRSTDRHRRRRSPSRDRSSSTERRRRYNRTTQNKRRPESLMREMRQLGRPNENKVDYSVYIGNIDEEVSNRQLKATFSRYGRVLNYDFGPREKYGEVYIDYHQREDAFKALEMNRVKICGKRLRVALNCRKPANRDGYSVIVETNEPVPERDLYARFVDCGDIEFIWHHNDATIATITFERPEAMLKALVIKQLHNRISIMVREYIESER